MRRKTYIKCEPIERKPDADVLTKQEKEARIYDLARKMQIKIGKSEKTK